MVKNCCVVGCKSVWIPYNNNKISLHKFPHNINIRSKWIEVLKVDSVGEHSLVCGLHFKSEDFVQNSVRKRLKYDSIPSYCMDIPEEDDCETKLSASEMELDREDSVTLAASPSLLNDLEEIEEGKEREVNQPTEDTLTPVTTKYIMCRICLAREGDKRYYHMNEKNLYHLYEEVTGVKVGNTRPQHVCWECAYRLQTYAQFKTRAVQANSLLQTLPSENSFMLISSKLKDHFSSKLNIVATKTQPDFEYISSITEDEELGTDADSTDIDEESADEKIYLEIDEPDVKIDNDKFDMFNVTDSKTNGIYEDLKDPPKNDVDNTLWESNDITKHVLDDDIIVNNTFTKDIVIDEVIPSLTYTTEAKNNTSTTQKNTKPSNVLLSLINKTKNISNVTTLVQKELIKTTSDAVLIKSRRNMCGYVNSVQKKIVLNDDIIDVIELCHDEQVSNMLKRKDCTGFKEAEYKCVKCYKWFEDEETFQWHMTRHDVESGSYACDVCSIRFKLPSLLKYHNLVAHAMRFKCKLCTFITTRRRVAKQHESYHNGATFQCPYCPKTFGKVSTYFSHVRIKHPSDSACEQCGYMFLGAKGVEIHKKLKHKFDQAPLDGPYCKDCDIKFASEEAYERHLRLSSRHSGDQDPNRITDNVQHEGMMKKRTSSISNVGCKKRRSSRSTPLECEQCGVEVPNMQTYSQHFRRSHPGRKRVRYPIKRVRRRYSYMCEQCGKTFHSPCLLRHHMWVHAGAGKPFACERCGKTFTQKSSLESHRRAHDTPPAARHSHECPDCGKHFATRFNMVKHTFIHTGLKPFECESCGKSFRTIHQRQAHFDHVHLNKPWPVRPDRTRRRRVKTEQPVED